MKFLKVHIFFFLEAACRDLTFKKAECEARMVQCFRLYCKYPVDSD